MVPSYTTKLAAKARQLASTDQRVLRALNGLYVDALSFAYATAALVPGPLRSGIYRSLLAECGQRCSFDRRVYIKFPHLTRVGDNVSFNRGVEIYPGYLNANRVTIGSDVYLAPHVKIFAAGHQLDDLTQHEGADITIGNGTWIGAGAIILPGANIGEGAVIGSGSVVTASVPDHTVAAGNPARIVRTIDRSNQQPTP